MKFCIAIASILFSFVNITHAQVKIGGTPGAPPTSAVLELDGGSDKGLLLPRMRKIDIDVIQNPAEGLTIYATDEQAIYLRKSLVWEKQTPFNLRYEATVNSPDYLFRIENTNINTSGHAMVAVSNAGSALLAGTNTGYGIYVTSGATGTAGRFTSFVGGKALTVYGGRTGIGTLAPETLLHIDGKTESGNTITIDDDVDPVIQFRKAGINKSYIKQEGNNLVFRPNDQNSSGKVVLQSYNDGGWLFVDAAGNTSLGINPVGFTSTPFNSRMNVRGTGRPTLTLDGPSTITDGPSLGFVNKAGNITLDLGSISVTNEEMNLKSAGRMEFENTSDINAISYSWSNKKYGGPYLMSLTMDGKLSGALNVSGSVGIGTSNEAATLHIVNDPDVFADAVIIDGTDPIARIKNFGVDKGFLQVVDNDFKVGTVAANNNGRFIIRTNGVDRLNVDSVGYVTIGGRIGPTLNGPYKLAVKGKIAATDFNIVAATWADYVFADEYKLTSLSDVEAYIKENKHLPNIPSAAAIEKEGYSVAEMQKLMMEKIEELTLHLIEANKEIKELKKQIATIKQ